jgi:transposase
MIPSGLRIFVAIEPIDMRCSIDGLVAAVAARLKKDAAAERAIFVFVNARRDRAKMVWRNHHLWSLLYTRLDVGYRVLLPKVKDGTLSAVVDARTLAAILDGAKKRPTTHEIVKEARARVSISSPTSTMDR